MFQQKAIVKFRCKLCLWINTIQRWHMLSWRFATFVSFQWKFTLTDRKCCSLAAALSFDDCTADSPNHVTSQIQNSPAAWAWDVSATREEYLILIHNICWCKTYDLSPNSGLSLLPFSRHNSCGGGRTNNVAACSSSEISCFHLYWCLTGFPDDCLVHASAAPSVFTQTTSLTSCWGGWCPPLPKAYRWANSRLRPFNEFKLDSSTSSPLLHPLSPSQSLGAGVLLMDRTGSRKSWTFGHM